MPTLSDHERIAAHFAASSKCRKRRDAQPTLQHEPGCTFIACQHEDCRCALNDPGDFTLSEVIQEWRAKFG